MVTSAIAWIYNLCAQYTVFSNPSLVKYFTTVKQRDSKQLVSQPHFRVEDTEVQRHFTVEDTEY